MWKQDKAFCEIAKVAWPAEFRLASYYVPVRGRAAAMKKMSLRHEGFRCDESVKRRLRALEERAQEATDALSRLRTEAEQ